MYLLWGVYGVICFSNIILYTVFVNSYDLNVKQLESARFESESADTDPEVNRRLLIDSDDQDEEIDYQVQVRDDRNERKKDKSDSFWKNYCFVITESSNIVMAYTIHMTIYPAILLALSVIRNETNIGQIHFRENSNFL